MQGTGCNEYGQGAGPSSRRSHRSFDDLRLLLNLAVRLCEIELSSRWCDWAPRGNLDLLLGVGHGCWEKVESALLSRTSQV